GVELHEQIEDQVQYVHRTRVASVDLVDDDDRPQLALKGLAQHEARLRQRPLGGVHEQQATVRHLEHALDLAAEVGVARRVDDVDLDAADGERDVFRQDGDAAFAFEIVGIEDEAVLSAGEAVELFAAELSGLAHHLIDERGLAMIDVSYYRNVA